MNNGFWFAAGWIGCNLFFAGVISNIGEVAKTLVVALRKRRRWTIGGTTYKPRRITRAVMEQLTVLQTHTVDVPLPVLLMTGAGMPDDDDWRERQLKAHSARTQSMYETAAILLEDDDGESPSLDALDELTVEEVQGIVGACL